MDDGFFYTFKGLNDRLLQENGVRLEDGGERLVFQFLDGERITFRVEGDCCSYSWIEHLEAPENVYGRTIIGVSNFAMVLSDNDYDVIKAYQTIFRLDNGESIKLEFRNRSNGYYGGYLVREGVEEEDY